MGSIRGGALCVLGMFGTLVVGVSCSSSKGPPVATGTGGTTDGGHGGMGMDAGGAGGHGGSDAGSGDARADVGSGGMTAGDSGASGSGGGVGSGDARPDLAQQEAGGFVDAPADRLDAAAEVSHDGAGDGPGDAPSDSPTDGNSACLAGGADPFEGVWTDTQSTEKWVVTNSRGCTTWVGSVAGAVCDYCVGTYTVSGPASGNATLSCTPRSACSVSPAHTDVGSMALSGCSFTYQYSFGTGNASETVTRVADAPGSVCDSIDGGLD